MMQAALLPATFLIALLAVLAACAGKPVESCIAPVSGLQYCLLPPNAIPADDAPRMVTITTPEHTRHMLSQLATGPQELTLHASTLLGQPLFAISWSGNSQAGFNLQQSPDDLDIQADWLIAILQFAFAEPAEVNRALRGAHMESRGNDREIVRGDNKVVEITHDRDVTQISIPRHSLIVRIQRLDETAESQ